MCTFSASARNNVALSIVLSPALSDYGLEIATKDTWVDQGKYRIMALYDRVTEHGLDVILAKQIN